MTAVSDRGIALLVTAVVIAAVVTGLLVMPSPADERARQFDQRRAQDLHALAAAVDAYRAQHGTLPQGLQVLRAHPRGRLPQDPRTGGSYEYRALGEDSYELCAEFEHEALSSRPMRPAQPDFHVHGSGRECFRLPAAPD